jgi:hypothetical protein
MISIGFGFLISSFAHTGIVMHFSVRQEVLLIKKFKIQNLQLNIIFGYSSSIS